MNVTICHQCNYVPGYGKSLLHKSDWLFLGVRSVEETSVCQSAMPLLAFGVLHVEVGSFQSLPKRSNLAEKAALIQSSPCQTNL